MTRRCGRWILGLVLAVALASALAACGGGPAGTPRPAGYPLNACPTIGEGAVLPSDGFQLVAIGEIVFEWDEWHNETPQSLDCGAQSVKGAKRTVPLAGVATAGVRWVATLQRAVPLVVPDPVALRYQVFQDVGAGPTLFETKPLTLDQQYRAEGVILAGAPAGRYRLTILSQVGEVLAEGTIEIVD